MAIGLFLFNLLPFKQVYTNGHLGSFIPFQAQFAPLIIGGLNWEYMKDVLKVEKTFYSIFPRVLYTNQNHNEWMKINFLYIIFIFSVYCLSSFMAIGSPILKNIL